MKRIFLIFVVLIVIAYLDQDEGGFAFRRPDPLPQANTIPPPSPNDPVYIIEPDEPCAGTCRGSAFAIDDQGHYLTARHVLAGCRRLAVLTDRDRPMAVTRLRHHPYADLSLLETEPAANYVLPVNLDDLSQGEDGFHYGFPGGNPGEVHSTMLGRAWTRRGGLGGKAAPVVAWAEARRSLVPAGSLGGMSGGAVLDSDGAVVGVTILEAPRRGRVISAAPESLDDMISGSRIRIRSETTPDERITAQSFPAVGRDLRANDSVVRVYCWA